MSRTIIGFVTAYAVAATFTTGTSAAAGQQGAPNSSARPKPISQSSQSHGVCTMALSAVHATIEVRIPNAGDYCELVSQALASDVFRSPVSVTLGQLWHYVDAAVSCRIGYRRTRYRMTIRNSPPACRWLTRPITGWHQTWPLQSKITPPLEVA